jgi:starch-binding outer membrane protein SusE/F
MMDTNMKRTNMNTLYKNILATATLLALLVTVLIGCKDDDEFNNVSVTAVNQFYEPVDDRHVALNSKGSMYFEWEKSIAADNSIIYYDVVFDKADGDFSNPLQIVTSDNKGIATGATISHVVLNRIAMAAGIDLDQPGTIKWTVRASRGLNFAVAEKARTITLLRMKSVAELEGQPMYIAGEGAAEAGQEVRPHDEIVGDDEGPKQEIYTRLEAGKPVYFTSNLAGKERYFSINEDRVTFKEFTEVPAGITVAESGVYRIRLDFQAASASIEKIDKLELYPIYTQQLTELSYIGKGVWQVKDYNVNLPSTDWGFDERYKFIFTVDGAQEDWGQNKNGASDGRPKLGSTEYRYMGPTANGQWSGNPFKFPDELCDINDLDKSTVDVTVYMDLVTFPDDFTHEFTNIRP